MHPLLKLLATNKNKGQPIRADHDGDEATLYLYDAIVSDDFWGGVSAQSFVKALNEITADVIHIRIDSPGGDVFPARAMAQAIREHKSTIIAHIDGWCASAATFIAVAADDSVITPGGVFMIHKAWTIAAGNADDFTSVADVLSRLDETIVADYQLKTDADAELIRTQMTEETYFFGQEAVDAGFVDALAEVAAKNKINWDMSAYQHAPAAKVVDTPADPIPEPEPEKPDLSAHYRQLQVVELTA